MKRKSMILITIAITCIYWTLCIIYGVPLFHFLPMFIFGIIIIGTLCVFIIFREKPDETPQNIENQQPNEPEPEPEPTYHASHFYVYEDEEEKPPYYMPPQEDYDPAYDPYFKWMPNNKWHDEWLKENSKEYDFNNSEYIEYYSNHYSDDYNDDYYDDA